MRNSFRVGTLFSLILVLIFFLFINKSLNIQPGNNSEHLIGQNIKESSIEIIQGAEYLGKPSGNTFSIENLKGSPVILNFWASWCESCAQESYILESLWQKYQNYGLKVVGISVHDNATDTKNFVRKFKKSYIIGVDEEGKAALDFGVTGVPETVIINRAGKILEKITGPTDLTRLQKKVVSLLNL